MQAFAEIAARTFVDAKGRKWTFDFNVAQIETIKRDTGFDVMTLIPDEEDKAGGAMKGLHALMVKILLLRDIAWATFKPECEKQNIIADDFSEGLTGPVIDSLFGAFIAGVVYFFPPHARSALLRALMAMQRMTEATGKAAEKELANLDYDTAAKEYLGHLKKSLGRQQEPPASPIPAPTASGG